MDLQDQLGQSRKMRALGTMAGKFAHHFNNILGSVVTSVDFAKQCSDMRIMRKTMHSVAGSLQRATTMLNELLAFAEADHRDTDLADLTETILHFAEDIKPTLDERNVEFDLKLARVPVVEVPRNQFLTVLNNLAGNAVEAMMHGGRLSVELAANRDHVVCRFVDTGEGIAREHLEHVLEPFYSTKNPDFGAGIGRHHGLGLSVALGIVHEMGGDIAVSSTPGRMTTIEIKLPLDPSKPLRPEWEDAPQPLDPVTRLKQTCLIAEHVSQFTDFKRTLIERVVKPGQCLKMAGLIKEESRQIQLRLSLMRGKALRNGRAGPDHGHLLT